MKKYISILNTSLTFLLVVTLSHVLLKPGWTSNNDLPFDKKGCSWCHFTNKGLGKKPYPSKQQLAKLDYKTFKNVTNNGRAWTAMTAKKDNLNSKEIKTIYKWLQRFK